MLRRFCLLAVITSALMFVLSGCGGGVDESLTISAPAAFEAADSIEVKESDWPWWRGPRGDNMASGPTPPLNWSETQNVIWKAPVGGRGHSSPIVVGDRVYLMTAHATQEVQSLLAFDRQTGEQLYESEIHNGGLTSAGGMHQKSTHANATPATDGTKLFLVFLNGGQVHLTACSMDGSIVWQTPVGPFEAKFGYAPSPLIYNEVVIVACDNRGSGFLAAVHRKSGAVVWRRPRKSVSTYSSPIVVTIDGRDLLVISGADDVAAYDPSTGEPVWTVPGTTEATCGTIVQDGKLLFASGGHPGSQTICVDGSTGREVWQNNMKCYEQSMLVVGGHLYAYDDRGIMHCFESSTGSERWKQRLTSPVSASLVGWDDRIYAMDEYGKVVVCRANPDGYAELATNQLGNEGFATLTICDGRIYLRTATGDGAQRQEYLYCLGDASAAGT